HSLTCHPSATGSAVRRRPLSTSSITACTACSYSLSFKRLRSAQAAAIFPLSSIFQNFCKHKVRNGFFIAQKEEVIFSIEQENIFSLSRLKVNFNNRLSNISLLFRGRLSPYLHPICVVVLHCTC